jgi:formylglycine-generating enzyme required for sulfatase activity
VNRRMNNRCGAWGVWLAAMVLCLGTLPGVATADEQDVAEGTGEATAPPLAVAPFDAAAAKAHQEAWAKHLGVPVTVTNSIGMKLVLIPPGEFLMGSPMSESDACHAERPWHRVRITNPFYLGVTEVTQEQYERVTGANPSHFKGAQLPVETVSWEDAMEFCRKLSGLSAEWTAGRVYRLPTEGEWEYGCRAGSTTRYYFGEDASMLGDYAWYAGNSGGQTHPVGQKKPNGWGLYDMHGNVSEWCSDWYSDYSLTSVSDPTGPASGVVRVDRGGGMRSFARRSRSASRLSFAPSSLALGFRVAYSPVDQSFVPPASKPLPPWDLPPNSPPPAIAPFNAAAAKTHQEAWAEYLGKPVEVTNSIGMKLMLIPPGEFVMGSPWEEIAELAQRSSLAKRDREAEQPQHPVRITKPFYLGMHEVTQAQWESMMDRNLSRFRRGAEHPVELVSWKDCQEFIHRLNADSGETGRVYRLPTEAEWEYACRAGTTTRFHFGDSADSLGDYAWHFGNSGGRTHPVGQKRPNAWGLYDMHGNVLEWCADWYSRDYYANSPIDGPQGPASGLFRVRRGGGLSSDASLCRSANRQWGSPGGYIGGSGFRLARTVSSTSR